MKSRMEAEHQIRYAISQTIRRRRERLGLQQYKCAMMAGISDTTLSNIERANRGLSLTNLIQLSTVLQTSPSEILDEALMPVYAPRGLSTNGLDR